MDTLNTKNCESQHLSSTASLPHETTCQTHELDSLEHVAKAKGLAWLLPQLEKILKAFPELGDPLPQALSQNITQLQEAFIDLLYDKLRKQPINLEQKITFSLNGGRQLYVAGAHPQEAFINEILLMKPEFSRIFLEIAALAAALRSIQHLFNHDEWLDPNQKKAGFFFIPSYQLSLLGEMNHFYFK